MLVQDVHNVFGVGFKLQRPENRTLGHTAVDGETGRRSIGACCLRDMMVQLMYMIDMQENRLCSECDIQQATNGDVEDFCYCVNNCLYFIQFNIEVRTNRNETCDKNANGILSDWASFLEVIAGAVSVLSGFVCGGKGGSREPEIGTLDSPDS